MTMIKEMRMPAGLLYEIKYGQVVVLTFQVEGRFDKGNFLRGLKNQLGDYEIRNYRENNGKGEITLVSRSENLTDSETNRETSAIDSSRMREIINANKGLKFEQVLIHSSPTKINSRYSI